MKANTFSDTKHELLIGFVLLLISGVFLLSSLNPSHNWGGDFAAYIHQGKALAHGSVEQFNVLAHYRVENSSKWNIGPVVYPWGLPALLAVVIIAFGESILAMKVMIVGFVLGCQVVTYLLLRGRTSMLGCYAVAFTMAMNSFVYVFKESVLSDIPFAFFVLFTLLLGRKFLLEKKDPSIANLIAIGVAMFAAFSIRTHAIALLPTIALLQLLGKIELENRTSVLELLGGLRRFRLPDCIPYFIFAVGTVAVSVTLSDPVESYTSTGHVLAGSSKGVFNLIKSGIYYYGVLPNALINAPSVIYVLVIVPLLLFGVVRAGPRNIDLLIYVFFHMSILMIFPGRQGLRFVMPLLPIMPFFLYVGARECANWFIGLRSRVDATNLVDAVLVMIFVVGLTGPVAVKAIQDRLSADLNQVEYGPYSANSQDVFDYIRKNIKEDENIVFWKPRVLTYLTDKKGVFVSNLEDLISGRCGYVLVLLAIHPDDRNKMSEFLADVTSTNPHYFRSIYNNPDFVLYEVLTPTAPSLKLAYKGIL